MFFFSVSLEELNSVNVVWRQCLEWPFCIAHVRSALGRPGVRAGGGRASLTNLGVLVTYIRLSSPSAVGLRRRMRTTVPPVIYM